MADTKIKNKCEKCKKGQMIEYVYRPEDPTEEGSYFAPRLMAKCNKCGQKAVIQRLPNF